MKPATSKPALLCTLGVSWAVVPEAFLLGLDEETYSIVSVVTNSSPETELAGEKVKDWFANYAQNTELRVYEVEGLQGIMTAHDHVRFETAFYRVYFGLLAETRNVHVCLAGGFKTMSATAQEAAGLLGCARLFHVLAPPGIDSKTDADLRAAMAEQKIQLIDLGSRSGWPTIRDLAESVEPVPRAGGKFLVEDTSLSNAIHQRMEVANRLAASATELTRLPFPQLARWSPAERASLDRAVSPDHTGADHAWLLHLPKFELHCHLGGFASHGEKLRAVRDAAGFPNALPQEFEPELPRGWPIPESPVGLQPYRKMGDATGSALLRDPGCLERHIELLYEHFQEQHIRYAEVRCSPANYADHGRSAWDVLSEIRNLFERCRVKSEAANRPAPLVNLIVIATRQDKGDFRTHISRHLALAATAFEHWTDDAKTRVVGVDLAGFEDKDSRAHYFRDDFMAALRLGMGVTVHAGETDDAEGIWSAILDLNARRLGHALHLSSSPSLLRTVADRRIGIEMCPYANLQIKGYPLDSAAESSPDAYPLRSYLKAGVSVSVNTDNIGISAASLTDNFLLLPRLCPGITKLEVLQLARNALDQAFIPADSRDRILAEIAIIPPA